MTVSRLGKVTIKFERELFVENHPNLGDAVKNSGSIQVQLINSAIKSDSSAKDFDWSFGVEERRKVIINLFFNKTGAISSTGNDYDQIRVVFVDTKAFLRCETVADLFNQS